MKQENKQQENKTKILLRWNSNLSRYERHILNHALTMESETEEYYFESQYDGEFKKGVL